MRASRMLNPSYSMVVPPEFPIQVHEAEQKVTVQAGITQRMLLDYLAAYKCALPSERWRPCICKATTYAHAPAGMHASCQ